MLLGKQALVLSFRQTLALLNRPKVLRNKQPFELPRRLTAVLPHRRKKPHNKQTLKLVLSQLLCCRTGVK